MDGTGLFYGYISCDPQKVTQVIETTRKCLQDVRAQGVTEQELQARKNKIASNATLHGELPMGRLVPLGSGWTYRQSYITLAEEIKNIQAVTCSDIQQIMDEYPPEKFTLLGLGPCEKW